MPSPAVPDDPLHRLFSRLVENIAALDPALLTQPITVADIHERLIPYRTHRVPLGFDTAEDYELTVLRLLAGEYGLVTTFPEDVREAFARELTAVNPDLGVFRQFPDASVLLEPEQVAAARGGTLPPPAAPLTSHLEPAPTAADEELTGAAGETDDVERPPFLLELDEGGADETAPVTRPRPIGAGAACSYCGDLLPVGRTVLFCPHCGQNVGVVHCPTCGSELDVGWQFCITCGQKVSGLG